MKKIGFIGLFVALFSALFSGAFAQQAIRNLSVRALVGVGNDAPTGGFVIQTLPGAPFGAKKRVLIRAIGPTLGRAPFNLPGVSQDPKIDLYQGQTLVTQNAGWDGSVQAQLAFQQVGAFALVTGSKDAVVFADLAAGAYTAVVTGTPGGIILLEFYDVSRDVGISELINISARVKIGTGAQNGIVGIVVDGTGPRQILARVAGAAELAPFGVNGAVSDPKLTLYNNSGTPLMNNDDWGQSPVRGSLPGVFSQVGAFPFPDGSKGSVILFNTSGVGTASYTLAAEGSGIVVVEAYRL